MPGATEKCPKSGQEQPQTRQTGLFGRRGFTLVEIMIVVAILGVVSAIAVPNFVKARTSAQVKTCIANLKQIQGIKSQWAVENRKSDLAVPTTTDLLPYLNSGNMPPCPAGGTYRIRRIARDPTCTLYWNGHSLSNLDADEDPAAD